MLCYRLWLIPEICDKRDQIAYYANNNAERQKRHKSKDLLLIFTRYFSRVIINQTCILFCFPIAHYKFYKLVNTSNTLYNFSLELRLHNLWISKYRQITKHLDIPPKVFTTNVVYWDEYGNLKVLPHSYDVRA